jgi:hypothetical protein
VLKHFVLVSIENEDQQTDKEYENYRIYLGQAVLLALMHKNKLTQWHFDRCMELLHKQKV